MIEVEHDGEAEGEVAERCCFCRSRTHYWFAPKDVACCQKCAKQADAKDVPAKKKWCRNEDIATTRGTR